MSTEVIKTPSSEDLNSSKSQGNTLFRSLGMDQNKYVLQVFIFMTFLLVFTGFGSFFLFKNIIPILFPNVPKKDSGVYAGGISAVITHIIVFVFYFWAKKYDIEEEKHEKELKFKKE